MSARDKIAEILEGHSRLCVHTDDAARAADAIFTALPDMIPDLVWAALSRLEWDKNGIAVRLAESCFGEYRIRSIPKDSIHMLDAPDRVFETFDSYIDAKAAANAHHKTQLAEAMGWSE